MGYVAEGVAVDAIQPGMTEDEVQQVMGSPSTVSDYGVPVWYYLGAKVKRSTLAQDKVASQRLIAVTFDGQQRVTKVEELDASARKDVTFAEDATPTEGNEMNMMQQLLGNLGRFNPNNRR